MEYESPLAKDTEFTRYWNLYVNDVVQRDNFKVGHLEQLRILCQLYTEFDKLTSIISEKGYTYETETRNGLQVKVYSEVTIRKEIMLELRMYSKMLGLILEPDKVFNEKEESKSEWEWGIVERCLWLWGILYDIQYG